jgi:4,5-DOPA dioxygenase extradiol
MTMNTPLMPMLFVGHGSPLNALEDTIYSEGWKAISKEIPTPKAILAISARYYADGTFLNDAQNPKQIYDMYGFPDALYRITYHPQGNPVLAKSIANLVGGKTNASFGIDHGIWSVLRRSYPEANIPVIAMSVNHQLSPQEMVELGKKLKVLREQGILLFGTGSIVHNLYLVDWDNQGGYPWAEDYQKRINERVLNNDVNALVHFDRDPDASKAFTSVEHYAPLLYLLGARDEKDHVKIFNDSETLGSISMTSYLFY